MTDIKITTDFIRLDSFIKLANLVGSGGQAKMIIQDGLVKVNDEVCIMRGKKLYGGEIISVDGEILRVVKE